MELSPKIKINHFMAKSVDYEVPIKSNKNLAKTLMSTVKYAK